MTTRDLGSQSMNVDSDDQAILQTLYAAQTKATYALEDHLMLACLDPDAPACAHKSALEGTIEDHERIIEDLQAAQSIIERQSE